MKTGSFLMKWARSPQNEAKVPFKVDLPLRLKNSITGKGTKNKEKGCLHEITILLACLEKHKYENSMCNSEVTNFQQCYQTFLNNKKSAKEDSKKGKLTPGVQNLKYKQINQLLARYPQINN